ncbi:TIGR02302 family protein [Paracoccus isoporae]|uniref:TIGR02302 family protein n=1 Tax=Paracoccus isoporae TaxID=591205 RepID=A0A1G7CD89_9RHOB|nr:DUF4175 family protein [Paracoccus isoporae]SDE37332.1 TIGR02302 family protein [Paracoccus isoporae]
MDPRIPDDPRLPGLTRALRLTRAGLWWEALARAFWPLVTLILLLIAGLSFGAAQAIPDAMRPTAGIAVLVAILAVLIWNGFRFRQPTRDAAERRLDRSLPGRPLSALRDNPAIGGDGALWQAHRAQMVQRARGARRVSADAQLSRRDPFAFRLAGLTAVAMALLFGSAAQIGQGLAALAPSRPAAETPLQAVPDGLGWEGWAEPPAYTRKPTIYLNRHPDGTVLDLPEGSRISLRLYGDHTEVTQDVGQAEPGGDARAPQFRVEQDGMLSIGDRQIQIAVRPDDAPQIALGPPAERRADGRLIQSFSAQDDFGLTEGKAEITLDLARVDRRHGLEAAPETRPPLRLALPIRGARAQFEGQLDADLKKHAWANLPVEIRLNVQDGIGQTAQSEVLAMDLPGRRFFDPMAAALIELRRDIMWSRENAPDAGRLLRAIIWQPDDFIRRPMIGELRAIIAGLETEDLTDAQRDALAEALWRVAVEFEDGGLADALERMRRAQDRLAQAMRRGASPDEIRELMDELRRATDDYLDRLAEQGGNPADRFDQSPAQMMSGDQIQQMMDEIQRLMNEGRMAEAQALLEQFNRMMENMQVRQGEGQGEGERRGSSGRMAETLREQQDLADEAYRDLQDEWMGLDGESPTQPGAAGEGEGAGEGENPQSLAERQRQLRDDLGLQRGLLPERGTAEGDAAGEAMDRAGRAMQRAEEALENGDMAGALDRQAEAIEALRDGIRALDQGQQRADGQQQGQQGQGQGTLDQQRRGGQQGQGQRGLSAPRRDPLGRAMQGTGGGISTDEEMASPETGDDRARDLQAEIRRRLGERSRPQDERDYLDRLIDRF